MDWFGAATTEESLFRKSVRGERIYAPLGARGPLFSVSDTAAERMRRNVNVYIRLLLAFIFVATLLRWGWSILLTGAAVGALASRASLSRGLPRATARATELLPVERQTKHLAAARATGRPLLLVMLAISIVMGLLGIAGALYLGQSTGWLLTALMSVCGWLVAWQLTLLKKDLGSH